MAELSQFEKDDVVYDLKDSYARDKVDELSDIIKPWKYGGKFIAEESVNPFVVTEDSEGNPLVFTELQIDLGVMVFHLNANSTCNRSFELLDSDGNPTPGGFSLDMAFIPIEKGDTADGLTVDWSGTRNTHAGVHIYRVGNFVYAQGGVNNTNNLPDSTMQFTYSNKGTRNTTPYFTGFRLTLGYATNLIVKGSYVEFYYR